MTQENQTAMIQVEATVKGTIEKIWSTWTEPGHIKNWYNASPDWHAPEAENDMRTGGKFRTRMEAKDGSMGFDFGGEYTHVKQNSAIDYKMEDGRTVNIRFTPQGDSVHIVERFDPETLHPHDFQKAGWQAILDNFKKYAEAH